jgi:LysR family transcriptional activator of nhaA
MNRLKDINWNHLYCFYEVARAQSIKKGAKILGTAPSTVSEQIKKLEETFSQTLFNRSSKGLSLTVDGHKLFDRTRNIFEEGSKLLEEVSEGIIGGYPVKIGIDDTISYDLANEFASQYWDYYTMYGTVNTVRQEEHSVLVDNVIKGNIDWGISVHKPKRKNINYQEIGSFELVFCCANELYNKFKNKEDILINIPFAENSWDTNLSKLITMYLRKNGIVPKEKIYSDHSGFLQKLCKRGRCVMCIPANPLEKYDEFKTFKLNDPLKITLYAIWRKSDENLVSIQKLKELISSKISHTPFRYKDIDLQIEVSEVSEELLTKKD